MEGNLKQAESKLREFTQQINSKPMAEKSVEMFTTLKMLKNEIE